MHISKQGQNEKVIEFTFLNANDTEKFSVMSLCSITSISNL